VLRRSFSIAIVIAVIQAVCSPGAWAVMPGAQLLPDTTKGYLSIPDMDALLAAWEKTQLGELVNDPMMKPFADDLKRQLKQRMRENGVRLEVTIEDLEGVYGGEICLAATQPGGEKTAHAVVMLIDVTGHVDQANALLAKVEKNQVAKGAKKQTKKVGSATVVEYILPKQAGQPIADRAYYFLYQNQLVASDNEAVVKAILGRINGAGGPTLAGVKSFDEVMSRCTQRSGNVKPHIRWFVEPFGYVEVMRAAQGGRKRRGTDLLKVLRNQGFDAIQGLGGLVTLASNKDELLHRTVIYAPSVKGAKDGENYMLAARMLEFGPGQDLTPPDWVPRELSTYLSFTWNMKDAFYNSETLVNEVADDDIFDDVIDSILEDPHGPQIDIRNDLVAHLGTRGIVLSDYQLPISTQSERLLVAVQMMDPTPSIEIEFVDRDVDGNGRVTENEVPKGRLKYFRRLLKIFDEDGRGGLTKAQYLKARSIGVTLDMAMEHDPDARMIKVGDQTIWEIINKPQQAVVLPEMNIEGIEGMEGFEPLDNFGVGGLSNIPDVPVPNPDVEKPLFPNSAVTYVNGHVMVSTHVDMLVKLLEGSQGGLLKDATDLKQVMGALQRLGAAKDNFRFFSRTDEAYRATYELLKQGKMPEADTLTAKVLNRVLGSGEEGVTREQELDASKLPDYQAVRRYLGPAGFFVKTEPNEDGWYVVGTLLRK
jgi:hypothetical protein